MADVVDWQNNEVSTGTSIIAVEFNGGVVLGADSRTTTGTYIANRVTDKLTKLSDRIYCCRSGSAADTQAISEVASYHLGFHKIETGEEVLVKSASAVIKDICYNYRDQMSAGIIVAGWDSRLGGQVYGIPIGGMILRQPVAFGGSGSTYVYGYVDATFKEGMSQEECVKFVTNCLALAMARDGSSGGVIRIGIITEQGIERRVITDVPTFYEG